MQRRVSNKRNSNTVTGLTLGTKDRRTDNHTDIVLRSLREAVPFPPPPQKKGEMEARLYIG